MRVMSGNADIGGGEEYSSLGSFPIINLSLVHTVMEEKNGKIIPVCLDIKNQVIRSVLFHDTHFQSDKLLILLFGTNLKFLNNVQLQRLACGRIL